MGLRPQPYRHLLNERTFRSIDALRAAATERGVDMGALALAWVLSHPQVTAALIGPRRVEHFALWLEAVDIHLSPAERAALVSQMDTVAA
jgi:aryl-alcohol dehydrogenase-like predicted oxidoreductase